MDQSPVVAALTCFIKAKGLSGFCWCICSTFDATTCRVQCVENVLYTVTSWQLGSAAVCEGLKKKMEVFSEATSCLVLPSTSSATLPVSNLFLCFKGIFKLRFLADSERNVRETGSPGCVSVERLNLRRNKKSSRSFTRVSRNDTWRSLPMGSNINQNPAPTHQSPALI